MNSEPDNPDPISDDQLDALLREVHVPAGLAGELLAIAKDEPVVTKRVTNPSLRFHTWHIVLAACLLGVALFASWAWFGSNANDPSLPNHVAIGDAGDAAPDPSAGEVQADTKLAGLLAELEALQNQADYIVANSQLLRTEQDISRLESSASSSLSVRQIEALTRAVADQTSVNLGASPESAISDMNFVIEEFPDTQGAAVAQEFIDKLNKETLEQENIERKKS